MVILRKNKGVIQLTATAEVVVIHPHDVQKSLCLLNIVCMKEQPVQKFLLQFPPPSMAGVGVPVDGTCTRRDVAGQGLEEPPLP